MSTALVTGATCGIGLAFARALADRGHDVVLVARTRERLDAVAAELTSRFGVATEVIVADLADRDELERVADRLRDASRPVEVLVNNAGFGLERGMLDSDVADEERLLDVLVRAVLVLSLAAVGPMRARGVGAVVNVSSVAGFAPLGTYSAAKAWVTTFTESLAGDLAGSGVTATALCPGFTHTQFHERAGMHVPLPGVVWLDADALVRDCLADVDRGRVVSVPGAGYKAVQAVASFVPRPVLRAVSARLANTQRH